MSDAFRAFLFESSPELHEIVDNLRIKSEELSDKLHMVMQDAIYTWTEEQVLDKIPDVISEYRYLDALNDAMGKVYHSVEDAGKDIANLFKFVRIPLSIIEKLDKPWYGALKAMYKVSNNQNVHMTDDERSEDSSELRAFGKAAMDFLKDDKIVLSDLLEAVNLECTDKELADIYSGLGGMTVTTSTQQFEKELSRMKNQISQARNCILLQERWSSITGCETLKEWCQSHKAPIFWIVPKEQKKVFDTILKLQKKQRVFDSDVVSAISVLNSMDTSLLNDEQKIEDALLKVIGEEYAQVFLSERNVILSKAKMQLGNDMSSWDVSDLSILQRNLKNMQKEKAKKEKLSNTKKHVQTMSEKNLRSIVQSFLDAHPEFCDEFND